MSEDDAIAKAQAAVPDDRIVAAAWLLPRGFDESMFLGEAIGGGGGRGVAGGIAGAIGGEMLARHHDQHELRQSSGSDAKMPENALVGVSDTTIYCWAERLDGLHRAAGRELFAYPRSAARVTVHGRLGTRTFEVIDSVSGTKWEFESPRIDGHLGPVMAALGIDG